MCNIYFMEKISDPVYDVVDTVALRNLLDWQDDKNEY